jgi:hypothetical protein
MELQVSEFPPAPPFYTISGPRLARSVEHEQISHSHSLHALVHAPMNNPFLLHRPDRKIQFRPRLVRGVEHELAHAAVEEARGRRDGRQVRRVHLQTGRIMGALRIDCHGNLREESASGWRW